MPKKYLTKFAVDILPSVATVIGAYIVNHYIVSKPSGSPVHSCFDRRSKAAPGAAKVDVKADAKPDRKTPEEDIEPSRRNRQHPRTPA